MAQYSLGIGTINGINVSKLQPIISFREGNITIRLQGEPTPFIKGKLSEFVTDLGVAFSTPAELVTYWNLYFSKSPISSASLNYYNLLFARPDNATPYSIYDIIANSATSPTVLPMTVKKGIIMTAKVATGKTGSVIPACSIKVRLMNATITPIADNSPIPMLWANKTKGFADIDASLVGGGANSDSVSAKLQNLNIINDFDTIYPIFEAASVFTPVALQEFYFEIGILEL